MKHNLNSKLILWSLLLLTTIVIAQDYDALQYRTIGPERGGRVTTVMGTPMLPGTFYLGASGAGVWKSDDYGTSWNNVSDGFFTTPSIGAIQVALNDPNIVYVGTGSDGLRSNVIGGKGMYKSIDAGKTWEHIGLKNVGQIGAVEIDPTNSNIVWVAAIGNAFKSNPERGIYKTIDGGQNWKKVLFISDKVGFSDLELLPSNPNVIYAAAWKAERKPWTIISGGTKNEGGIYKSVNGGNDWVKLENGLPEATIGKIDLAVSPVDSSILYAIVEAPEGEQGLYKSVDQGKSFEHVSDDIRLVNRPFYYTNVELDPTNPDIVYSNANPLLKSIDGGKSWKRMSVPHGDNHDIWLNPNNPEILIQANDGGANVSLNGGKTWSTQFNQPTAELYQVEVDDQYPYWLYAGQQDNYSTIAVPSFPP
ncbi:MAG: WD40/YVTN/BNR-like repeat-containing protein, partial [Maribacter sp.]